VISAPLGRTALGLGLLLGLAHAARVQADYSADLHFAVEELEKQCGELIRLKKIDWQGVTRPLVAEAEKIESDQEHLVLLARLCDGHAEVQPLQSQARWPSDPRGEKTGPGMFLCRVGKKLYVKNSWNDAERVGISPGMELLEVGGQPAAEWLAARQAEILDTHSFSTPPTSCCTSTRASPV
jgi:hypothetical protein